MGYLSQKKHHERINMLLNVSLGIISITTLLALMDNATVLLSTNGSFKYMFIC